MKRWFLTDEKSYLLDKWVYVDSDPIEAVALAFSRSAAQQIVDDHNLLSRMLELANDLTITTDANGTYVGDSHDAFGAGRFDDPIDGVTAIRMLRKFIKHFATEKENDQ